MGKMIMNSKRVAVVIIIMEDMMAKGPVEDY
jgi:hypothetical protein